MKIKTKKKGISINVKWCYFMNHNLRSINQFWEIMSNQNVQINLHWRLASQRVWLLLETHCIFWQLNPYGILKLLEPNRKSLLTIAIITFLLGRYKLRVWFNFWAVFKQNTCLGYSSVKWKPGTTFNGFT